MCQVFSCCCCCCGNKNQATEGQIATKNDFSNPPASPLNPQVNFAPSPQMHSFNQPPPITVQPSES